MVPSPAPGSVHVDAQREAITELYLSERRRLLRLAALFVGADRAAAEDLVHDAFAALQRMWATLDDATGAAGYLSVSVANAARSLLRRRQVALRWRRAAEPDLAEPADASVLLADEHRQVVEAVRRLPRRQQQVIALRYWSRLSEAEIAKALGVSVGTVKSSAARAIANIERQLEAEDA